jgi:hypothetical protein
MATRPKIRDSSVGIATGYGLDGSIPGSGKIYSLLHCVQSGSVGHPDSLSVGTRGSFPWIKRPGHEVPRLIMMELYLHLVTIGF